MRRILVLAALISLIPVLVSYAQVVTDSSSTPLGVRSVEWLRDNGAKAIVNKIESIYYTLTAPSKGGPGLKALPTQAGAAVAIQPRPHHHKAAVHYDPRAIQPVINPGLPGEGTWHAPFMGGGVAHPPVLITSFRPEPDYPRVVAGVAWIDHTETSTVLYPGAQEPAVPLPSRGPEEIPPSTRSHLVAAFNSAFKLSDSGGGVVIGGHTYAPMQRDIATIVRYSNGRVDVVAWPGGTTAGPDVAWARQNLPLIVDNGLANPNLSSGPEWGATLGNAILVWRSAVGIDRRGNLMYVAAPDQTVASLAAIMIHAGAVRAMELDINSEWPSFIAYRFPGASQPANLLPGMSQSPERYLTPADRDFFAVYLR